MRCSEPKGDGEYVMLAAEPVLPPTSVVPRIRLVASLSFAAGYVDANTKFRFMAFGSLMSGNAVELGIAMSRHEWGYAGCCALNILAFQVCRKPAWQICACRIGREDVTYGESQALSAAAFMPYHVRDDRAGRSADGPDVHSPAHEPPKRAAPGLRQGAARQPAARPASGCVPQGVGLADLRPAGRVRRAGREHQAA